MSVLLIQQMRRRRRRWGWRPWSCSCARVGVATQAAATVSRQKAAAGLVEDVWPDNLALGQPSYEVERSVDRWQRGPLGKKHVNHESTGSCLVDLYCEHDAQLAVFAHHGPSFDPPRRGVVPLVAEVPQRSQDLGHEHGRLHRDLEANLPRALRAHVWCLADDHAALAGHRRESGPGSQPVEGRAALLLERPGYPADVFVVAEPWSSPHPLVLPQKVCEGALLRRAVGDQVVGDLLVRLEVRLVLDLHTQILKVFEDVGVVGALLEVRVAKGPGQVLREVALEPAVLPDLREGDSSGGVHDKHLHDQVLCLARQVSWQCEVPVLDLAEEIRHVLVVEGERPAQERVQDDAARPDVDLWPHVRLSRDDFRGCVVWGATGCLQELAIAHGVGEPEVRDLHMQIGVE
mmetsp:Transcript_78352/g.208027  ORF Transcript_78352/g.208027 Transcript_78352/m.208027 type:complete len:404 (-) Transcript_78352:522-1733(-)